MLIFKRLCPNCGGEISYERLKVGSVCEKCSPDIIKVENYNDIFKVYELLESQNKVKNYEKLYDFFKRFKEAEEEFKNIFGFDMWGAQRTWAKRLIEGKSFSILASTGVGKTTFGIFSAIYLSKKGKKIYLIFPTKALASQVYDKITKIVKEKSEKVVFYHGSNKQKEELKEKIRSGNFDILITTSQFLSKNFDLIKDNFFDLVFVDDVDALLKASKNIEKVLILLGFKEKEIKIAKELIKARKAGDEERVKLLEEKLREEKGKHGTLIIATATGSSRKKTLIYRELLGFEIGSSKETLRNIVDTYTEDFSSFAETIKKLGSGGLIFVYRSEKMEEIEKRLNEEGIKAKIFEGKNEEIEQFLNNEYDVLIGVASYYGKLVRGIDLPQHIRYVIFYGVPRFEFYIDTESLNLKNLFSLSEILLDVLENDEKTLLEKNVLKLRKIVSRMTTQQIKALEEGQGEKFVSELFSRTKEMVKNFVERENVWKSLKEYRFAEFEKIENRIIVRIPDVKTYIQASGRCSRLYAGGITKGLSIVFSDSMKLLNGLERSMKWRFDEFSFLDFRKIDVEKILEEIDKDRETVKLLMEGKIKEVKKKDLLKSVLMIVESPNKAKTIASFFSKPSKRRIGKIVAYETNTGEYILTVVATLGHLFDLTTKDGKEGVRINGDFVPYYDTIKKCENGEQFVDHLDCENFVDKIDIIESLKELALENDEIFIATDPDIEGEKIAEDVYLVLRPYNVSIFRTEFHEVTKKAIRKAIEEKRKIDENLVKAQIVRRIEDRWIGFGLSKKLWEEFKNNKLSAGRVQTPVLGWTINREEEYRKSISDYTLLTLENGLKLRVKGKIEKEFVEVLNVKKKEKEMNPLPPYTTDTLLEDASRFLKFSSEKTMNLAQDLFEMALITYHRTDSTRVSDVGMSIAKEWISETFGEEFVKNRSYASGGAHECIRPTKNIDADRLLRLLRDGIISTVKPLTKDHIRLYDLIFRRFMASQMKAVKVLEEKIETEFDTIEGVCKVLSNGWNLVWNIHMIPKVENQKLKVIDKKFFKSSSVSLFTEGELVKEMKMKGIGRPSTYAKIVSILLKRKYVAKTKREKLIPTKLGKSVFFYLDTNYHNLVSEERTRILEEQLDMIEKGEIDYQKVLKEVFEELKKYKLL